MAVTNKLQQFKNLFKIEDLLYFHSFGYFVGIVAENCDNYEVRFTSEGDLLCSIDILGTVSLYDACKHRVWNFAIYEFPEIYFYDSNDNVNGIDYFLLLVRIFRETSGYWKGQLSQAKYMTELLKNPAFYDPAGFSKANKEKTDDADNCKQ